MPCPPSFEELRVADAHHHLAQGKTFAARLASVLLLLGELVSAGLEADDEVRSALAFDATPRFSPEPDWWGNSESSEEVLAWVAAVAAERARLEVALCEVSTVLVRAWDRTPEALRTDARQQTYARAEEDHSAHREADRMQVLRDLRRVQGFLDKGSAEYQRFAALCREVAALPIERLLRDRSALPQV